MTNNPKGNIVSGMKIALSIARVMASYHAFVAEVSKKRPNIEIWSADAEQVNDHLAEFFTVIGEEEANGGDFVYMGGGVRYGVAGRDQEHTSICLERPSTYLRIRWIRFALYRRWDDEDGECNKMVQSMRLDPDFTVYQPKKSKK